MASKKKRKMTKFLRAAAGAAKKGRGKKKIGAIIAYVMKLKKKGKLKHGSVKGPKVTRSDVAMAIAYNTKRRLGFGEQRSVSVENVHILKALGSKKRKRKKRFTLKDLLRKRKVA